MKFNIEGTMISDIKIDKKTGWTIEAKIKQDMSGNSSVKPNEQLPDGMIIPMTIKSDITVRN